MTRDYVTNQVSEVRNPLNRLTKYTYDLAGNLTTFTDRKNQVSTFQYDALNRRINATYADATTTFTYDSVGRLIKASDSAPGAGTIDFAYDILNRLTQEITPLGTVSYQYDVLGRRTQMVANGQQPTSYQYDAGSRLIQVAQGALFAALGYDNANRRTSLGYSNNTTTSYAYDLASRLTNITHNGPNGVIEALAYTYDAAGNRLNQSRANGTASLLPTAVPSASYDATNEQTQFAGATLMYDNNGNLTNDGVNSYQWDARNRLVQITGGVTGQFSYDALGRRTSKMINGTNTQFQYDRNDVVSDIGGGAVGATYFRSLSADEPFARLSGVSSFFHTDGLGSSLSLTDQSAATQATYAYEAFGKTTSSGTSTNPFQFTNRENDDSGIFYYRNRYYSPTLQRFLSEDPLGFRGNDWNLYGYVGNRPTAFRDPFGLCYDQGGSGTSYCVQAFIPYQYALMYQGDDRGSTCNDSSATYRSMQWLNGDGSSGMVPGLTVNSITGNSAPGIIGPNDVSVTQLPLGGRKVRFRGQATNGLLPGAPSLKYDFTIIEDSSGNATVSGTATNFPGFEVCQYGGPNGTVGGYFPPSGGPITGPFTLMGGGRSVGGPLH